MKKIAIITASYGGSSLALAKSWIDEGYFVDYIKITQWRESVEIQACDCTFKSNCFGLHKIDKECWLELSNYYSNNNFNLYLLNLPRPYKTIPVLRNVANLMRNLIVNKVTRCVNRENYDSINVIGRYDANDLVPIIKGLSAKVFLTLHETSNQKNNLGVYDETPLMKCALDRQMDVVVHSDTSYNDVMKYTRIIKEKVHNIPFGPFYSYSCVSEMPIPNIPNNYLLYFGYIQPYKGLKVLYDAVTNNPVLYKTRKILVVGIGNDPILDKIKKDEHFICINRFVTDNELVTIIKNSYAVICPYLNMSQSGVPQTTIVFKKPLIVSDLPSFRDVITDGIDGLFFEAGNSASLNDKVEMLYDGDIYQKLMSNMERFDELHPTLRWENIAKQYINSKLI